MKLVVVALFALFPGIFLIGEWLLSWTEVGKDSDNIQIVLYVTPYHSYSQTVTNCRSSTMGVFPIVMNILQFWLIDSIVKGKPSQYVIIPAEPGTLGEDGPDDNGDPIFTADDGGEVDDIENQRSAPPKPSAPTNKSTRPKATGGQSALAFLDGSHSYPPSSPPSPINRPRKNSNDRNLRTTRSPPAPLAKQSETMDTWEDSWGDEDDGQDEWTSRNTSWHRPKIEPMKAAWATAPATSLAV